ncbi:unnamed protein product [Prorocentrum cordatum]|uniref:Uncharacterized protein n=1 Tax=Prorocentrum cordatum TaxID=2364126 RepID=A0ABN9TIF7_9DINO|nr:unnamed protein product [Polarella glacialis]
MVQLRGALRGRVAPGTWLAVEESKPVRDSLFSLRPQTPSKGGVCCSAPPAAFQRRTAPEPMSQFIRPSFSLWLLALPLVAVAVEQGLPGYVVFAPAGEACSFPPESAASLPEPSSSLVLP